MYSIHCNTFRPVYVDRASSTVIQWQYTKIEKYCVIILVAVRSGKCYDRSVVCYVLRSRVVLADVTIIIYLHLIPVSHASLCSHHLVYWPISSLKKYWTIRVQSALPGRVGLRPDRIIKVKEQSAPVPAHTLVL